MKRSRRLLLVSHCVLNQNSVVRPLARASGGFVSPVRLALEAGVGLIQLPCPELAYGGCARLPATREEYDTASFRSLCAALAVEVAATLRPMVDDGCAIVGVLGIDKSPSCSVGEPPGLWMEELLRLPILRGVRVVGVPERYPDSPRGFLNEFRQLLRAGA